MLLACGGGALAQSQYETRSDWERKYEEQNWKEGEIKHPAYPSADRLIEFQVSAASSFRFFIDPESLSVGPDGIVRYVLVARSSSGAESVTFEGMRCASGSFRIYAVGRADRTWGGRAGEWRAIQPNSVQRWHHALRREFFCPFGKPIASRDEGVDALRRGGHPSSRPDGWSNTHNR